MAHLGTIVNAEISMGAVAFGMIFLGNVIVLHQLCAQNWSDLKWYLCLTLHQSAAGCGKSRRLEPTFRNLGSRWLWPQMWQPGRRCMMQNLIQHLSVGLMWSSCFPQVSSWCFSWQALTISGRADDHDEGRHWFQVAVDAAEEGQFNYKIHDLSCVQRAIARAPGVESDFYAFLNEQRDAGAPQSRLAAMVESVRFMEHVVGLTGVIDLLSRRCLGAAKLPTCRASTTGFTVDSG